MKERSRTNYIKTLKIAAGSAISIIIANLLSLSFGTAAGIITLLSVQNTKKETLRVAGKRILAFVIAMGLAKLIFTMFGYYASSFGLFLFLFVIVCEIWDLQEGISICAVLVTHFLTWKHMNRADVWNEFLLLMIGIAVGAVTNLYVPRNVKEIKRSQIYIEERIREILSELSYQLMVSEKRCDILAIEELHYYIQRAVRMAYENSNNTFLADAQYFISYMELRLAQLSVIERIYVLIQRVDGQLPQAAALADFMKEVSDHLRENNNGEMLLKEYEKLKFHFEQAKLPTDRQEFETRAVLYQILCEMQWFLQLKSEFSKNLTPKQVEEFWNEKN